MSRVQHAEDLRPRFPRSFPVAERLHPAIGIASAECGHSLIGTTRVTRPIWELEPPVAVNTPTSALCCGFGSSFAGLRDLYDMPLCFSASSLARHVLREQPHGVGVGEHALLLHDMV